jgi:hypothetical protein
VTSRPCLDCGTPGPGSRCEEHEAERLARVDLRRGTATQRGYDGRWKRLSEKARKRQPFCLECHHIGSKNNPLTVHHLRWPATSLADVEVLCQVHNNRRGKTPK